MPGILRQEKNELTRNNAHEFVVEAERVRVDIVSCETDNAEKKCCLDIEPLHLLVVLKLKEISTRKQMERETARRRDDESFCNLRPWFVASLTTQLANHAAYDKAKAKLTSSDRVSK